MIGIEVNGRDLNSTGEIVSIDRAPNEDVRVIEKLAARTSYTEICLKPSII
jgi:hypothetical protein